EIIADPLDFRVEPIASAVGDQLAGRMMERQHVWLAAITMSLDKFQLGIANRVLDPVSRIGNAGPLARRDKIIVRLEEVDVGIPQRIVGVKNQIQCFTRIRTHHFKVSHDSRTEQSVVSSYTCLRETERARTPREQRACVTRKSARASRCRTPVVAQ